MQISSWIWIAWVTWAIVTITMSWLSFALLCSHSTASRGVWEVETQSYIVIPLNSPGNTPCNLLVFSVFIWMEQNRDSVDVALINDLFAWASQASLRSSTKVPSHCCAGGPNKHTEATSSGMVEDILTFLITLGLFQVVSCPTYTASHTPNSYLCWTKWLWYRRTVFYCHGWISNWLV